MVSLYQCDLVFLISDSEKCTIFCFIYLIYCLCWQKVLLKKHFNSKACAINLEADQP